MQNNNLGSTKKNVSGDNIDITMVPNEEPEQLANCIEAFYKQEGTVKARLSYNWDKAHKFLDGDQWLVFDGDRDSGGTWKRLSVSKANEYIPRPVTNYVFDAYQTLKAYLIKNKPRSTVRPNTQTYKDKSAAKVAELCLEANWERLCEQENYEYAAACMVTYGTVFKKSFWDTSSNNMVKIPKMIQQPKTDPNTGAVVGMEEVQARDEQGQPLFDSIPLGDVNTVVVEPYRMCLDPKATGMHNAGWIMEYSIQSLDWIKETYGKEGDGYTGLALDLKEETQLSGSMRRFHNLKNSSGVKASGMLEGSSSGNGTSSMTNVAVVKEYYERPSSLYPQGRMIVVANNKTLFAGASPCTGTEMGDWHPYSECRWEIFPGRFWGKGPLDNIIEVNKRVNSIDATIVLTRKTMAVPQKLVPIGSGVAPGTWTGRPGQQIDYREGSGAKPELLPGLGADQSVFQERSQACEDIKNLSGAIDILKGDKPEGVDSASGINLLYEIGTGKLFPVLDRWKRFVEMDQKKQLKLMANKYREPRPDYIAMLKMKNTELSEESINKFIGEDLYDNCNVIVEAGSNIPKLQAAQQARLQEAAQAGTLQLENPTNRLEYNRQMGITGFDTDVEPDQKRAEWENDKLDNVDNNPQDLPIVLQVDNDDIHISVLSNRMKEPSWMEASVTVQQAYMKHLMDHMNAKSQKDQQAAMEQMAQSAAGQPPQQPGQGGAPQKLQPHGKGPPAKTMNSINKADMPPVTMPK